jgi:hypothetical protein
MVRELSQGDEKSDQMWCHYCDKNSHNIADYREISKFKQQKKLALKPNLDPERNLWSPFSKKLMHPLKRQLKPEKTASNKRGIRHAESLLCTEINKLI